MWDAHLFGLFNTLSWQVVLGAPVVLFAKSLGASATLLGVITAMMPVLVILQIPAAKWLPKYGYRRFTLMGWSARTVAIFAMAGIALLGYVGVSPGGQLWLLLLALLAFNTLRGIASGAWLPWFSALLDESDRARFLARDQVFQNVGGLLSLSVSAVLLSLGTAGGVGGAHFAGVFLLSGVAALVSLHYCARIPDVTAPETLKESGHPVPWREMVAWAPFRRVLTLNLGWLAVTGGLGTFTVAYLRGSGGYSDAGALWLACAGLSGALASLVLTRRACDAMRPRSLLTVCATGLALVLVCWALIAGGVVPGGAGVAAAVQFVTGGITVQYGIANNRLLMSTVPAMGRNHFFAIYSVVTSLVWGAAPIVWGLALDALARVHVNTGPVEWNRYTIYFAAAAGLAVVTAVLARRAIETTHKSAADVG